MHRGGHIISKHSNIQHGFTPHGESLKSARVVRIWLKTSKRSLCLPYLTAIFPAVPQFLPGCARWRIATLYVDGAELLQGALVGGGQAGVGQRSVPLSPAATAGPLGAVVAGYRGAA